MKVDKKGELSISKVKFLLKEYFGKDVSQVMYLNEGGSSSVFSFSYKKKEYVVKLSKVLGAYETEPLIANLLSDQGIPYPKCIGLGKYGEMEYMIAEKVTGGVLANCSHEEKQLLLPELIQILSHMNHVSLGETRGYGWITPSGDGSFGTWKEYLIAFFSKEQSGYWKEWHNLFQTTCLEKEVFNECYNRLMAYADYNEPYRHFIHGDLHPWNILTNGTRITGIIDSNCKYGDFLVDVVNLDRQMKEFNVIQLYLDYQKQLGAVIPEFKKRVIGAKYFIGLDGLRLFAKMGWDKAYYQLRNDLLNLSNE